LPEERSQELLKLMEKEDAEDIKELLKYPDDSAGGIMIPTSSPLHRPDCRTGFENAARHFGRIRNSFYIYVLDKDNRLVAYFLTRAGRRPTRCSGA